MANAPTGKTTANTSATAIPEMERIFTKRPKVRTSSILGELGPLITQEAMLCLRAWPAYHAGGYALFAGLVRLSRRRLCFIP